jgi:hypothetical protein
MWGFVADMMAGASAKLGPDGSLNSASLAFLGDAIHTVQDFTSPMHTSPGGEPLPWKGIGFLGSRGIAHWMGESGPDFDWAGIGRAVRLTMAAYLQTGAACEKGKTCLTKANFESEVNKNISQYVKSYIDGINIEADTTVLEDRTRLCALGNPAACGH